jgi:membrane protease YdiL (CAAX protease family)
MFVWIAKLCGIAAPTYAPLRRYNAKLRVEILWLVDFLALVLAVTADTQLVAAAVVSIGEMESESFADLNLRTLSIMLASWISIEIMIRKSSSKAELDALVPPVNLSVNRLVIFGLIASLALTLVLKTVLDSGQVELPIRNRLPSCTAERVMALVHFILFAPVFYEIIFRGFIQGALRRVLGTWVSIFFTGLVFAVVQYDGGVLLPVMLLPVSLILGITREISGQLGPSFLQLVFFNALSSYLRVLG